MQEAATFLGPQNRTQGRCAMQISSSNPFKSLGRHFSGRRRPFKPLHRGGHVRQDLRGHRDPLRGVRARKHHQLAEWILRFRYKQPKYY